MPSVADILAPQDIVVGMAQDIDPKYFAVFAKSFRESNPAAKLYIYINEPVPDLISTIAARASVDLIPFRPADQPNPKFHPSTTRWLLIADLLHKLKKNHGPLGRVLMTDVRDTYFQSDPFTSLPPSKELFFFAYADVQSITISECGWNGGWVKDCFGPELLRQVGASTILCSGVSAADFESALQYVNLMTGIISGRKSTALEAQALFPQCERNGVDQGIHNVLVHTGALPQATVVRQDGSAVVNMQANLYDLTPEHVVNNMEGRPVSVAHQYDRNYQFQSYLFKKYVDWMNPEDVEGEWRDTPACARYEYKRDVDDYKGVCDIGVQGGASGPASCCKRCNDKAGCRAFVHLGGTCFLKSCGSGRGRSVVMSDAWSASLSAV